MVLTGNAQEIQAAVAKATVRGAMGATATQQVEGNDRVFGAMLADYCQMKQNYLDHLDMFTPEGRKERLLELQTQIEDIVNFCYAPNSSQASMNWNASWPITLGELYEDYNIWTSDLAEVNDWLYQNGETQDLGPIENMFRSLDENHHALNPHFVYDMMEPGIGRVNYFRGKVKEYQNVINQMNNTVQNFIAEFGYAAFSKYAQEFDQRLADFQNRLGVAQNYLDQALQDLPSWKDVELAPEQEYNAR